MRRAACHFTWTLALAAWAVLSSPLHGATVYLQTDMPGGQTWTNGVYWSNGLPAAAGNDYVVGTGGGAAANLLRTPETANPTFPGTSLVLAGNGVLAMKHTGTVTFSNLQFQGGTIGAWTQNRTMNVGGTINVATSGRFESGAGTTDQRSIGLTGTLTGAGPLTVAGSANPAEFTLNANTAGYSGTWTIASTLDNLNVDNGTMNVASGLTVGGLRVGYNGGTGVLNVQAGAVSVGTGGQTLWLGRYDTGNVNTQGTANFGAASSTTLNLAALNIGTSTGGTSGQSWGTLTLSQAGANAVTATSIAVGDSPNSGNTANTSRLIFGGADNTVAATTFIVGGRKSVGEVTIADNGNLTLGSASARTALYIGRNNADTGTTASGTMDLDNGARLTAYLSSLNLGIKSGGGSGYARGTLNLPATSLIDVSGAILVGDSTDGGQDVAGRESILTLGADTTLYATTFTLGGRKSTAAPVTVPAGGTLTLGKTSQPMNLRISYNNHDTASVASASLNTTAGTFNGVLGAVVIGHKSLDGGGSANGTLSLGAGSATATSVVLGELSGAGAATGRLNLSLGGTLAVSGSLTDGGGSSRVDVTGATLTVGGGMEADTINVGTSGRASTLTVTGGNLDALSTMTVSGNSYGANKTSVTVGDGVSNNRLNVRGTMTQTGGHVTARGLLAVGEGNPGTYTLSAGRLTCSDPIDAVKIGKGDTGTLTISGSAPVFGGTGGTELVSGTLVEVSSKVVRVGNQTAGAGTVNQSGGEVRMGQSLRLGNDTSNGTYNLSGGALTITDTLLLGAAGATGTYHQTAGTASAGSVARAGTSWLRVDGGTLSVGSDLASDNLRVGFDGRTATLTVGGGDVTIGTGTEDAFIGRKITGGVGVSRGTVNFSACDSVTMAVGNLNIGTATAGGSPDNPAYGTLLLGAVNNLTANAITIASSTNPGLGGDTSRIAFGTTNNVLADTFTIAGSKGLGRIDVPAGATFNLAGRSGDRTDVFVANQTVGTGGGSTGTMDLTGVTFNAMIDQWILASKPNSATGTTTATVTMTAGEVDANGIILGRRTDAGEAGSVRATFNLKGGTLTAGSITRDPNGRVGGSDLSAFHFTGGTLHVGQFGTPALPLTLSNTGAGTLAPGNSVGTTTLYGNYVQGPGAAFQVEIDAGGADLLDVHGQVTVDGLLALLLEIEPAELTSYIIVNNDSSDPVSGRFDGLEEGAHFRSTGGSVSSAFTITYFGGDGNDIALTAVPEPLSLLTLALAGAGVGGYLRRRR